MPQFLRSIGHALAHGSLFDRFAALTAANVNGALIRFQAASSRVPAGVWIDRETYDGVHGNTKGRQHTFWRWDPDTKILLNPRPNNRQH